VATLAENMIRVDLNAIEIAHGLKALAEAEGVTTHKKTAALVHKSPG
jgi:ParB-like chromosome segregation protein Spo0J